MSGRSTCAHKEGLHGGISCMSAHINHYNLITNGRLAGVDNGDEESSGRYSCFKTGDVDAYREMSGRSACEHKDYGEKSAGCRSQVWREGVQARLPVCEYGYEWEIDPCVQE